MKMKEEKEESKDELDEETDKIFSKRNKTLQKINDELLEHPDYQNDLNDTLIEYVCNKVPMVPIAPIEGGADGLYLIGTVRCFVDQDGDNARVRVGTDYEPINVFVKKNKRHFQRTITYHMKSSGEDYGTVVGGMMQGKKKFAALSESKLVDIGADFKAGKEKKEKTKGSKKGK